jgi:hypothetical protein
MATGPEHPREKKPREKPGSLGCCQGKSSLNLCHPFHN